MVVIKSYDEPVVAFEGNFDDGSAIAVFVEEVTEPQLVEMDQCVTLSFQQCSLFPRGDCICTSI